jgi:RimJ/RimL family protein N-acetyltransferase
MFARTERLLLRPGFPEDAPALAAAIGHFAVVRNLARVPWPYGVADAQGFLAHPGDPHLPSCLITERTGGAPLVVGGCGLHRRESGAVELGYWIAREHWGRGIATEAGHALVNIARALRLPALEASHFLDNPASGRVLEKLGFEPTGIVAPRLCRARSEEVPAKLYRLRLKPASRVAAPPLAETLAA